MSADIPGLLVDPRVTFARFFVEHWEQGKYAARRIRQLRKLVPSVQTKTYTRTSRWTAPLGTPRVSIAAVAITYNVPAGVVVPPPDAPEDLSAEHDVCPVARTT